MTAGIAIDAMGGDRAPREIVRGAVLAARQMPAEPLFLVGDPARVESELKDADWDGENIHIVASRTVIDMGDKPVEALRKKRGSSVEEAVLLIRRGEASAVVSAGNTGACVAAATLRLGLLPLVRRAGIAVAFYAGDRPVAVIDVGASVSSKPEHLLQHGIMAGLYAREILRVENPRVGLLNVGEEDAKGNQLAKLTHSLFQQSSLNFRGNIEGVDIFRGLCDVVVCDGFTGNIVLKVSEGLAERLLDLFKASLEQAFTSLKGSAGAGEGGAGTSTQSVRDGLHASLCHVREKMDYSEYGGAPLLGVNGVVIISHGRSDAKAIFNAVRAAKRMTEVNLNERITQQLQMFSEQQV